MRYERPTANKCAAGNCTPRKKPTRAAANNTQHRHTHALARAAEHKGELCTCEEEEVLPNKVEASQASGRRRFPSRGGDASLVEGEHLTFLTPD